MCSALATQRFDVLQCREVGRDSKERGEDTSSPLSLAGRGGSEGLLTARHPFEKFSLHLCQLIIKSEFPKTLSILKNLPSVGNSKFAANTPRSVALLLYSAGWGAPCGAAGGALWKYLFPYPI